MTNRGEDVVDQIRKLFGIDLIHQTGKYTVRRFEILILLKYIKFTYTLTKTNQQGFFGIENFYLPYFYV